MLKGFLRLREIFDGPELWDTEIFSRQDAKSAKLKGLFLGGLYGLTRGNPRVTGARSAPYNNLRVLRAFVVNPDFLVFGCGVTALGLRGDYFFTVNPEAPN